MNAALKPYLARSMGLHALTAAGFVFMASRPSLTSNQVYMIDFVGGPAATIQSAGASAPAAPAPAAAPAIAAQADPDSVRTFGQRRGPIALPRPSLLRAASRNADAPTATGSLAGPGASAAAPAGAGVPAGANAGAGVSTDLPNFPYPWYISQVRLMLWQSWQQRMPPLEADGALAFSILRNGSITDLSVESSSGDNDFDAAAIAAVQSAAPFPALPSDFHEPFLKIHLSLKSQNPWR